MKKLRIILFLGIILSTLIFSEERNLLIGDVFNIKIKNTDMTLNEIKEKFKEFEIEYIEEISDGYEISLSSFETGLHEVKIGNKIIKINVNSAIDSEKDILLESDENFTNMKNVNIDRPFPVTITLFATIFIAILFLIIYLVIFLLRKNRSKSALSPYEEFILVKNQIENQNFLFLLTFSFKKYMKDKYTITLLGKTSEEIYNELTNYNQFEEICDVFHTLSKEMDFAKFSGQTSNTETNKKLFQDLHSIIKTLEEKEVIHSDQIS